MPLLANILLDAYRASYNPATGATSAPTIWLPRVEAHIGPLPALQYASIPPELTNKTLYLCVVDSGTDITVGDQLRDLVLIEDGVTPWPGDVPTFGQPGGANTVWTVHFHQEGSPGLLPMRKLIVERIQVGGPAHP